MRKIIASTVALGLAFSIGGAAQAQLASSLVNAPVYTTGTAVVIAGKAAAQTPTLNRQAEPVANSVSPALAPVSNKLFHTDAGVAHDVRAVGKDVQAHGAR